MWFTAVVAMAISAHAAQPDNAKAELIAFLRSKLPTTGSVEVVYSIDAPRVFGRIAAGFDVESSACYKVNNKYASGRDPSGRGYTGEPVEGGLRAADEARALTDSMLDGVMTLPRLVGILKYPDAIRMASPRPEGGYIVVMGYRAGRRGLRPEHRVPAAQDREIQEQYVIDSEGRIIETKEVDSSAPPVRYIYHADSPAGFPILAECGSGDNRFKLESFKFHPASDPSLFEMKRVERVMVAAAVNPPDPSPVLPTADSPRSTHVPREMQSVAKRGETISRWRWPMVGTGAVLLVVAFIAWRRARV